MVRVIVDVCIHTYVSNDGVMTARYEGNMNTRE
jgi:hypothetical protein